MIVTGLNSPAVGQSQLNAYKATKSGFYHSGTAKGNWMSFVAVGH